MIGKLTGRVDDIAEDHLILDVGGVGYFVYASARTLAALPPRGGALSLLTETHVREDHIHLYGFANAEERRWFTILTTVQGVGVRMALAVLGVFAPAELAAAIAAQDKKALTAVSGVGPKLAERIVTELKTQAAKMGIAGLGTAMAPPAARAGTKAAKQPAAANPVEDALSALVHLGYARTDAFTAVMRVQQRDPDAKLDQLIRDSLRELAA